MCPSPDNVGVPDGAKLKVLVVDDEPTLRLGFAYALTGRHTLVETAATGRQALERISATDYDIIILDLRMPDLDGLAVIDALRGTGNEVPVVLCSAALYPAAALRAIRNGVVDFLLKPVRPADLRQIVELVVRPGNLPLPLAMQAARQGRIGDAIRILENDASRSAGARCWLAILRNLDGDGTSRETPPIEEQVGANLSALAFNAPLP